MTERASDRKAAKAVCIGSFASSVDKVRNKQHKQHKQHKQDKPPGGAPHHAKALKYITSLIHER
jgi:hypothetical protein